jgi:glycosyltransferase involved in cell wall biosynthesis
MLISYCIPCMNRTYDLKKTLPLTIQAANESPPVEIVVVNYNSKDDLDEYMIGVDGERLESGNLLTYKKYTGREYYHMAHAQNLALLSGSGEYVINVGADIVPASNFFSVIRDLLAPGDIEWMVSSRYGMPVIRKDEFVAAGGHDERLEFYGKTDRDLHNRLWRRGGKFIYYPSEILSTIPTPRVDKFKNYSMKSAHGMKVLNKEVYEENMKKGVLVANDEGWGSWDA